MFFVVRTSENGISEVNGTVLVVLIFNSSSMARELYFELVNQKFYSQKTIGYVALYLNEKSMKKYFMLPRIIFHAVSFCSESD